MQLQTPTMSYYAAQPYSVVPAATHAPAYTPQHSYDPNVAYAAAQVPQFQAPAAQAYIAAPPQQFTTFSNRDELRTIFVTGFPQDVRERELMNLCRFMPGFEVWSSDGRLPCLPCAKKTLQYYMHWVRCPQSLCVHAGCVHEVFSAWRTARLRSVYLRPAGIRGAADGQWHRVCFCHRVVFLSLAFGLNCSVRSIFLPVKMSVNLTPIERARAQQLDVATHPLYALQLR